MTWKEVVKDPTEIKVFMALDAPKYTWRTVGGIARQTGLSESELWKILAKYSTNLIRMSETPSTSGDPLIGLIERVDS